jgi:hypothetical protein
MHHHFLKLAGKINWQLELRNSTLCLCYSSSLEVPRWQAGDLADQPTLSDRVWGRPGADWTLTQPQKKIPGRKKNICQDNCNVHSAWGHDNCGVSF